MSDFFDIPTLVIIGVAIFVLIRLRSVLGTRTGTEKKLSDRSRFQRPAADRPDETGDVVVPLHPDAMQDPRIEDMERARRKFEAELDRILGDESDANRPLRQTLIQIGEVDANFTPKSFLAGAGAAYEMIVTAFARGDKRTLKDLLDKEVYDSFSSAIDAREAAGHQVDFTFVGLPNIEYVQAELDGKMASITVRFDAEVVSATKDKEGNLIEGNEEQVVNIADEWTFSRNTRSRDPNWKLVATDQIS
ncbi:MAG TPA: Tim44/TimA family putative adaptor protein [Devosia sp.]|nr:Tim44/TimA family putative adaptor protein [Devosia sp.]